MEKAHQRGFIFLNVTQFCGAANDNILKQLLMFGLAAEGIWAEKLGVGGQAYASLCLAVPFVLLSGFTGQFSDRYSKRDLSIIVKLSEIFIAALAMLGLIFSSLWMVLGALILIAAQSAFFGPAKFGMLPELVPKNRLSRANGTLNMFTYLAVILGSALGGPLYDVYAPSVGSVPRILWLPGVILLCVAVIGTASAFGLPRLRAKDPALKIKPMLFRTYVDTWREIAGTPVASVVIAWSIFFFIVGGVAILVLPDYKGLLEITASEVAGLMALLAISTGVGDFVAGRVSGEKIRPELITLGAVGTTVGFFLLGVAPLNYYVIALCLAGVGFMAGFFMVPLQTMIQHLTTPQLRGRVLGLWNCGSFVGIIFGNLVFLLAKKLGFTSSHVFFLCGALTLAVVVYYLLRWRTMFVTALAEADAREAVSASHAVETPSG